ncbi:MAG: NAD(+)/NADH kinase [Lachnospiraceae bacterium]|nr:NAD(+)/NADH kinase [Lachnospiraceae bacterium]
MDKFCIITNNSKDSNYDYSNKIKHYLVSKGASCITDEKETVIESGEEYRYTNPSNIPDDIQCVITIGGDGTILQAAHDLINRDVVIIGINRGNLGYLAVSESNGIEQILDNLIDDNFKKEKRMMLQGRIVREGKTVYESVALNDIIIHRDGGIRVADYDVSVNNTLLNQYHADGVIVATPTGSTAYNLSAGGPIVEPNASLMVLTPICAHSINGRSIVLSSKDVIDIEIGPSRNKKTEGNIVAFDGYCPKDISLKEGDIVEVWKSELATTLAKMDECSFLQILKDKMGEQ